jgi:hypothetical protein
MSASVQSQLPATTTSFIGVQSGLLQRKCACGNHTMSSKCEECKSRKGMLQRAFLFPRGRGVEGEGGVPPIVHGVLRSPGQPLDPATRASMETRLRGNFSRVPASAAQAQLQLNQPCDVFEQEADDTANRVLRGNPAAMSDAQKGHDFSQVRVHYDSLASESAQSLGANAYTLGSHIAFNAGRYAPTTIQGLRLLSHELTHVIQQHRVPHPHMIQRELIYGSGYPNAFAGNPAGETAAAQKDPGEWFPSSVDFKETASLSGGGKGVATLKGLLAEIGGKAVGSIDDLDLIGHANADLFALGGTITRNSVSGSKDGTIGAAQLAAIQSEIDKVRNRFAAGGRITIYGCDSGASGVLLQAISTAFKVCARGFKDAITWCLGWQTKPLVINSRGRTLINPPARTPCDRYNDSVYKLVSDVEDCSGAKPKAPDIDFPKRQPIVPEVPE